MGSLEVELHFTNTPIDETIDIWVNKLFESTKLLTVPGFTKSELKNCHVGLQRSLILYLTVYFTKKLMV